MESSIPMKVFGMEVDVLFEEGGDIIIVVAIAFPISVDMVIIFVHELLHQMVDIY